MFEKKFQEYKKCTYCVAVSSCTAALHLSMIAAKLKKGDEVITTALTFCSTINSIIHSGATPVLADVNPQTMNIDAESIEKKITPKTKAIIVVHFAGRPCNMEKIIRITKKHNLMLIEDCAHAIESTYNNIHCGTFGDFGCFSFYVTKNLTTIEGGMVITKNKNDAEFIKRLALHGLNHDAWNRYGDNGFKHYYVTDLGFKYNMTDIQASFGIHQLNRIEKNWAKRKLIWERYCEELKNLPIILPAPIPPNTKHAYHLFTILINSPQIKRDEFLDAMTNLKIGTGVHYLSIPEHPYYQKTFSWHPDDTKEATIIGRKTISLPLSAGLSEDDVDDVINAVKIVLKG